VWADLDYVDPNIVEPKPSCVIESSPSRYQAFWRLDAPIPPDVAQDFSRRIAYKVHADKSGWDLEQLLRVPFTYNFKYEDPKEVQLVEVYETLYPVDLFDELPYPTPEERPTEDALDLDVGMPDPAELPTIEQVTYTYRNKLDHVFANLFAKEPPPNADWSKLLWRLINICFEAGMSDEETFVIAEQAKCNKYVRDNRPLSFLWREVRKASRGFDSFNALLGQQVTRLDMPKLVDEDDVAEDSFVAEYKEWANIATDAPEQYHELACFIALSAVVSSGLYLNLDFNNNFRPNLWGLLLGESTLTRKTTAMNMAMDIITDLDRDLILASDGSAEGLLTGLSHRPQRVSIFYKDEVSGFFDSINRKHYLAGLPEVLTKLYDVPKVLPRVLRKETITVSEPYFIFFGGGIRDKVYSLIDDSYILSGFLPRFLVVSSDNDLTRIRRTGPPTQVTSDRKDRIVERLANLYEIYNAEVEVNVGSQAFPIKSKIEAELTQDAWDFFGDKEEQLVKAAAESAIQMLALPTLQRLAFSMLKMAMLIAASRRQPTESNKIEVNLDDVKQAAYYIQKWGKHTVDLISGSGKSASEKLLDKVIHFVKERPGVTQGQVMQRFHLTSREWKEARDTLVDRGLVDLHKVKNGYHLYPLN